MDDCGAFFRSDGGLVESHAAVARENCSEPRRRAVQRLERVDLRVRKRFDQEQAELPFVGPYIDGSRQRQLAQRTAMLDGRADAVPEATAIARPDEETPQLRDLYGAAGQGVQHSAHLSFGNSEKRRTGSDPSQPRVER